MIEQQLHKNVISHIEENGYDNVTFKTANVYDCKGWATFSEIGKPKNPAYSRDNDSFIIQLSVRVSPGDEVYDKMKSLDRYMTKKREEKELTESRQILTKHDPFLRRLRRNLKKQKKPSADSGLKQ